MRISDNVETEETLPPLTCGGCGKTISRDEEPFALGAKLRPGQSRYLEAGPATMAFVTQEREVQVIVAAPNSLASGDGEDLLFPACSSSCVETIRGFLKAEVTAGNELLGPSVFPELQ